MNDNPPEKDELLNFIAGTVESIRDQIIGMRSEMVTKLELDAQIITVRGDIERVDLRLDSIEHKLDSRLDLFEAELSRLRSVVYLLAKDRPELLKLLGRQ